jgi:hypothetical protein
MNLRLSATTAVSRSEARHGAGARTKEKPMNTTETTTSAQETGRKAQDAACCGTEKLEVCCAPEEKTLCCGAPAKTSPKGCGCQ